MPGVFAAVKPMVVTVSAAALTTAVLAGCGSGDSTVAKTPAAASSTGAPSSAAAPETTPATTAPSTSAAPDPCAVNLAAPAIAKAVSELPRDPRSQQPWNAEPVAGNYSACADLSAVIVKANTNAEHPSRRALLFHQGRYLPQTAPDTYGFSGIDLAQCTADTVALQTASGIAGLTSTVKFHWNGSSVEIVGNTTR